MAGSALGSVLLDGGVSSPNRALVRAVVVTAHDAADLKCWAKSFAGSVIV